MTVPPSDHLAIAEGLERLIVMVRLLNPDSSLSPTSAATLYRLAVDGPCRLSELARAEGITQPAMTQLVSRLERHGLARRDGDPCDRRAVLVTITVEGREVLHQRQADRAAQLSRLLAELPAQDEQLIASALPALARLTALAVPPAVRVGPAGSGRPAQ